MWDTQPYKPTRRSGVTGADPSGSGLTSCSNVRRHLLSLQIKLTLNFDYNLQLVQEKAEVNFEAKR